MDVHAGGSAYSSLALVGESKVAILFEEPGDSLAFGILQPEMAKLQAEANGSPAASDLLWTARVQPCVGGANQSWSFAGGALKNAAAGLCVAVPVHSPGCGSTCGRVKLAPCSDAPTQRASPRRDGAERTLGPCWVALRIAYPGRRSCLAQSSACCAQQSQAHEVPTLSLGQARKQEHARMRKQVNACQINR